MTTPKRHRRFFSAQSLRDLQGDLCLDPEETHHLKDIIRLQEGDTCLVTDGEGREVEALIQGFSKDGKTHLRILRTVSSRPANVLKTRLRLVPAMLRKGKTDILVEKAQEFGVFEFWPVVSEHCEIQAAGEKTRKMVDRWNRIVREASKQSGALQLVTITAPQSLRDAVANIPHQELMAVFHPCGEVISFSDWVTAIRGFREKPSILNLLIGPEGGFSEAEVDWIKWHRREKNLHWVSLGETLLKADTAFVGVIGALRFLGIA